jgi:hypothetical protein
LQLIGADQSERFQQRVEEKNQKEISEEKKKIRK